ncbi:MAG TPA: agmatine deiminase family protein [Allosphingosinicella sp.]|nr:agmatine deiminase family protein [Allosphingosinicella sp.]
MTARQPPEWAPHDHVWIGFPSHKELWEDDLAAARDEVIAFARAVYANGEGEEVRLVAADPESAHAARKLAPFATVVEAAFGDIWIRDTGPIILGNGQPRAALFRFNGWGGKYVLEHDDEIGRALAEGAGLSVESHDWILEGGAIDVDGTGLAVTTEQCLLNPNRNPGLDQAEVESRLRADLGLDRIFWLGEGLVNDHTDGHVDNLARFVAEGTLAIPVATGVEDPNQQVYADARYRAEAFGLKVMPVPSVGRLERDGAIVPASYMNFYIGNAAVVVPTYGAANDEAAVELIGALFPGRKAVGLPAGHVLTGGGSFHCISQQMPA